jgi:hypothetical protein
LHASRYYLNGNDAYRLKLLLPRPEEEADAGEVAEALGALSQLRVEEGVQATPTPA